MLNPMHPPLAQAVHRGCRSVRSATGRWAGAIRAHCSDRSPIVAVYLCGLALFAAQGPAIAASLLAAFQPDAASCNRAIAMLDIFALSFSLFAIAAFMHGFRRAASACAGSRSAGAACSACATACKWSGLFVLGGLHRHRRGDPPDAGLAHLVRRRPARRLVPARSLAWLSARWHFALCFDPDSGRRSILRRSFRCTDCRFQI